MNHNKFVTRTGKHKQIQSIIDVYSLFISIGSSYRYYNNKNRTCPSQGAPHTTSK